MDENLDVGDSVIECNIEECTRWYYKGEGNANLIIALPDTRKVLRLTKYDVTDIGNIAKETSEGNKDSIANYKGNLRKQDGTTSATNNKDEIPDIEHKDKPCTRFYKQVVLSLFTDTYFQVPLIGRINESSIEILNRKLINIRPKFRQEKTIRPGYVTIWPDLTLLPAKYKLTERPTNAKDFNVLDERDLKNRGLTSKNIDAPSNVHGSSKQTFESPVYCVEIKPKQGFQPMLDRKCSKCLFCLHQYWKLSKKSITRLSDYCPLDLFSGDKNRMLKAIKSLLENPQNNLRIFKNGVVVYADNLNDIDDFLKDFMGSNTNENLDDFSTLIFSMLTRNPTPHEKDTFPSLLLTSDEDRAPTEIPSRFPADLINKVNTLLSSTSPCNYFSSSSLPINSLLYKILQTQQLDTYGADYVYYYYHNVISKDLAKEETDNLVNLDLNKLTTSDVDCIDRYCLSTMANDCSVLMAFQRCVDSSDINARNIVEDLEGNRYVFNISIADVDAKPVKCIDKHYKRDFNTLNTVVSILHK